MEIRELKTEVQETDPYIDTCLRIRISGVNAVNDRKEWEEN